MNPYQIFGVNKKAGIVEIKARYRELSKRHHPDKGGDPKIFSEISAAWEILSDRDKRKMYDHFGFVTSEEKIQKKTEALLQQAFQALVAKTGLVNMLSTDVIAELKDLMTKGIEELQSKQSEAEKNIKAVTDIAKRIKCKGKRNLISEMLQNDINKNSDILNQCKLETVVAKRTFDMIQDYSFEHDELKMKPLVFRPYNYSTGGYTA